MLLHEVLDVHLLRAGTRPSEVVPVENSILFPSLHLLPVEVLALLGPIAEEQPVAPSGAVDFALLQESPERRDTGSWADHDGVGGAVIGQNE